MRNKKFEKIEVAICLAVSAIMVAFVIWAAGRDEEVDTIAYDPNQLTATWTADANLTLDFIDLAAGRWEQPAQLDITDVNALTDATVVRLVDSGRVCEVRGHEWRSGGPMRNCSLCMDVEHQSVGAWK